VNLITRNRKAHALTISVAALATAVWQDGMDAAEVPTADAIASSSRQWSASARWENDTFGGTDRFYTDGISLSVAHTGRSWLDPLANWLPWGEGRRTVGYEAGQIMVTPSCT